MKILLHGMAESGLSTLFNQFKLLPNSVPLLSQNNNGNNPTTATSSSSGSSISTAAIVSPPYQQLTTNQTLTDTESNSNVETTTITTTGTRGSEENLVDEKISVPVVSSSASPLSSSASPCSSTPEEDENTLSSSTATTIENKPVVPSQALKPTLRRPTISPLQFTPPPTQQQQQSSSSSLSNNTTTKEDVFQSNHQVKFLKRRKQAFNEHFLKNLPHAYLSQLLISFKILIHHAERRNLLFMSEDSLQEFLLDRIVRDEKLENNYLNNLLSSSPCNNTNNNNINSNSSDIITTGNNLLLMVPNNNNNNGTSTALSSSYSDVETLIVPTSDVCSTIITNNNSDNNSKSSSNTTKAMIAKFNDQQQQENNITSSDVDHHLHLHNNNIKFDSKYKDVRNDLEKILKEQQKEFIAPSLKKKEKTQFTRQRSLSETLLVSQIKKLKQKRGLEEEEDNSDKSQQLLLKPPTTSSSKKKNSPTSPLQNQKRAIKSTTTSEERGEEEEDYKPEVLPPQYCEHCQKMAHAKLKVKPLEVSKLTTQQQYQYITWKIENTKAIVDRIKKITDMNQLYGVRLRSEFLKDCSELWENHIGLQHCFHSYSIFNSPDGGNIFSSLTAIMKWIVKKYLVNMPTKYFNFENLSGMESHASELGEDIATSCDGIPPEMSILLNTNFNVNNNTASARDYKFKFELPASHNTVQDLKISVSSSCLVSSFQTPSTSNSSSPVGTPGGGDWNILGTSFTLPNDGTNYSKSDSELVYPVNSGLYASLSKYRASTAINNDVISAMRPIILDEKHNNKEEKKKEEKEEEKKSVLSPRRLFKFLKSSESSTTTAITSEQQSPSKKPEKKKIKKEDTYSIFSVITMGGISPKVSFLKNEWIMCCYASNVVVFVVNLCDYFKTILVKSEFSDQLTEKKRISYSLEKFEQCVNGKYFAELPIVLCFTFVDVFEQAQKYHPITEKSEIEQIVQRLNPASYGQKKTENHPLNVHTKLDQKRKPWHDSCEFIIQQYIHLATSEQRRKQVGESFVVLNCIDSRTTAKVLVNDILFNEDLVSSANELETESSQAGTPVDKVKVNDGSKSDRSHYRKPMNSSADKKNQQEQQQPDYTQYYLRRCKTTTNNSKEQQQPSKITKQRKSINRKGGDKLKQELNRTKRLSWSNNGSIKLKKPEENVIVLDEYANEEEETEESPTTARRRIRKNSYQCSLQ